MQTALERVEAIELLARAGHADVAEAALLFDVVVCSSELRVRQDAFLHPGEKDDLELQALRRMERHQRDALLRARSGRGRRSA